MADFVYNISKSDIAGGTCDWTEGQADVRVILVSGSHVSDKDDDTVDAFTTLDELVATNYARGTIDNQTVAVDDANDRAELDGDNVTFSSLGGAANGTISAIILYRHVTNDTDSVPIAHIDSATGLPLVTNGGDVTITWDAEGILQLT